MDYRTAGVDIDAGNETGSRIRGLARSTFTPVNTRSCPVGFMPSQSPL